MKWTEIPSGQVNAAVQRLMVAFGDRADTIVERINADESVASRVAALCYNNGYEPSTSPEQARAIMGTNFFGVKEAVRYFGVAPSRQQLAALATIPFTKEVLKSCMDTHVLVAVFPLSILDIRGRVDRELFYSQDGAWYNKQAFARDKGEVGWHLVRKVPVADSTNKTWDEQQVLLGSDEETSNTRVMVYTIIGHFLATGERLFENVYVRCLDLDLHGSHVYEIGYFDARGLDIDDWQGAEPNGNIGLSAARKQ